MTQDSAKKSVWDRIKDFVPLLVAALTAVLGYISGSVIAQNKFLSDTQLQNQSYILELRQSAYNNFFSSQAKLQESERLANNGSTDEADKLRQEFNLEIRTARFQLAIFGTKPVIDALVKHFRTSYDYDRPCSDDQQTWENNAQIYQNMRLEVFGSDAEQRVDDSTLITLLYGCTPP